MGVLVLACISAYFLEHRYVIDKRERTRISTALNDAKDTQRAIDAYYQRSGTWPTDNATLNLAIRHIEVSTITDSEMPKTIEYDLVLSGNRLILQFAANQGEVAGQTIIFQRQTSEVPARWLCKGGTVSFKYRPAMCR